MDNNIRIHHFQLLCNKDMVCPFVSNVSLTSNQARNPSGHNLSCLDAVLSWVKFGNMNLGMYLLITLRILNIKRTID